MRVFVSPEELVKLVFLLLLNLVPFLPLARHIVSIIVNEIDAVNLALLVDHVVSFELLDLALFLERLKLRNSFF